MTVIHKQGNVVDAVLSGDCDVMLHVVNCQGVMGAGLAKEVKQKIPSAYHVYTCWLADGHNSLGEITTSDYERVINLHAQEYYGRDGRRYLSYAALGDCLSKAKECIDNFDLEDTHTISIGVPFGMGAGLAGGDFEIVMEMVEYWFKDHNIHVYHL